MCFIRFSIFTCILFLSSGTCAELPWQFEPLAESVKVGSLPADAPFSIPKGYQQKVIVDESRVDVYANANDWLDMTASNETGVEKQRYLYRTHEVRPRVLQGIAGFIEAGGGAVSVVDLSTGKANVLVKRPDWEAVDGLLWTPWGTLLFGEEVINSKIPDPVYPNAKSGLIYEVFFSEKNPSLITKVVTRPLIGSMAHEGIEVDNKGNVYVIDEHEQGSIFKFTPKRYGDLSEGQLYVLKVNDGGEGKTGPARWMSVDMHQAQLSARITAAAVAATQYNRPEDIEIIGETLYVVVTGENRVISLGLEGDPVVKEFVKVGMNVPKEGFFNTGFKFPDNLANGPGDTLWIVEDNEPSDIWVALPDGNGDGFADSVSLFGSLSTKGAEATGLYFASDNKTFYINIQHADDGNDKTIAVSKSIN